MKVEDCIVAVERRTTGGCIDLAFTFTLQFLKPLYLLTFCFAAPSCLLVWAYGQMAGSDILIPCLLIFAVFCMLLSGAMVAAVGPLVFGVSIRKRAAIRAVFSRIIVYGFIASLVRATGMCLIFPMVLLMAWAGHLPEVMFLEKTAGNRISERLSWLTKGGGYSRNFGRLIAISALWLLMALGLFKTIDFGGYYLLNVTIFSHQIPFGPDFWTEFASSLIDDVNVTLVLHISLWLTYPIVRLAWFFCYLDQRIRNECWDIDVQFRTETVRLREQASGISGS